MMMPSREAIVDGWKQAAAESLPDVEHDSALSHSHKRVRSQLYGYLLSTYGDGQWRDDDDREALPDNRPRPVYLDEDGNFGLQPKSIGRIRALLKLIHLANDRPPQPGPLSKGLSGSSWVIVKEFHRPWGFETREEFLFRDLLSGLGLPLEIRRRGQSAAYSVHRNDVDFARRLIEEANEISRIPNQRWEDESRPRLPPSISRSLRPLDSSRKEMSPLAACVCIVLYAIGVLGILLFLATVGILSGQFLFAAMSVALLFLLMIAVGCSFQKQLSRIEARAGDTSADDGDDDPHDSANPE